MPQGVLIVAEHRDGKIQGPTLEMIAKGRELVAKHGGKLSVALFGQGGDRIIAAYHLVWIKWHGRGSRRLGNIVGGS